MHTRMVSLMILCWLATATVAFGQEDEEGAIAEVDEDTVEPGADLTEEVECVAPCLTYDLSVKLQSEGVVSARPSSGTGVDTGLSVDLSVDLELGLAATEDLSFIGVITGETVTDWEPGESRALQDLGLYVSALYAEYSFDDLTIHAGKFDPGFGLASAQLEGLYSAGLSDAYDTEERWGVEAKLAFPGDSLSHAVTASLFTTDRTALSRSIGTDRDQLTLAEGGVGNVKGIGSAAIFYDICSGGGIEDCFADGDFGGRLGMRYQKAGRADEDQIADGITPQDEFGYLGAATTRVALTNDLDVRLLGELAYFRNFEGGADDALIATGSVGFDISDVTYAATYSFQRYFLAAASDTTDHVLGLSASLDLGAMTALPGNDWTLDVGYSSERNGDGTRDHKVGVELSIAFGSAHELR